MSTEEKVEMEAVPLKQDTDETKKEEETPADAVEEKKKEVPKKTWFFSKPAKKTVEEDVEEGKEKTKKKFFWNRSKDATETPEQSDKSGEMSIGIDLQMRDEKQINDHVKFQFEDIFGEPDSFHSWDCAWRVVYKTFEFTRTFFYRLFSVLLCIPAAIVFGILFALFTSLNVYFVVPLAKLASIPLAWISKTWSFFISNIFDPVANSFGLCFSKIHVRKYGINNAPTDLIGA